MVKKTIKKTLKNTLKVKVPFYKIGPGDTATIELEKADDIHYRGIQLGHLIEVKELPKKEKKVVSATVKKRKKKVKYL